jgi:hypothetical protein
VYRVLKALCRLLDDITWPTEAIELVSLLLTVLEHCTDSKRLRAHFAPKAQLLRKLQLQPHPQQQQQQQVQRKMDEQQQPRKAAAPATAGEPAAVTHSSPAAPASSLTSSNHLQQQQHPYIQSMVRPVVVQELTETTPGSAFASPAAAAAAAGPASPGQRPMGRNSTDSLRRTASGNSVSGVAYTRLAPAASPPTSPAHNASAAAGMHASNSPQQQGNGHAAGSSRTAASAGAALAASSEEFSAQGCALDPAVEVVAQQPVAPVAVQSVLGRRRALQGVTAQQLLVEPVVQALLRMLE